MALKVIGGLLVAFGAVDLVGSFAGFDLWGTLGIELPDMIWRFSAYIEIAAGYAMIRFADQLEASGEQPSAPANEPGEDSEA